jgi:hypothetical protein
MRLSNLRSKLWRALLVAFGIFAVLFSGYQLYSAAVHGTILQAVRGGTWVTFQSHPVWFVGSVVANLIFLAIFAALLGIWLFGERMSHHWRSRHFVDDAIRQGPEDR